ncbi:MAG TPA: hypothetical protein VFX16_34635 [Pseudonocardiaceae bacterium]|nr:hypothetical protein [Pseudonocardiaceae bacterium]
MSRYSSSIHVDIAFPHVAAQQWQLASQQVDRTRVTAWVDVMSSRVRQLVVALRLFPHDTFSQRVRGIHDIGAGVPATMVAACEQIPNDLYTYAARD